MDVGGEHAATKKSAGGEHDERGDATEHASMMVSEGAAMEAAARMLPWCPHAHEDVMAELVMDDDVWAALEADEPPSFTMDEIVSAVAAAIAEADVETAAAETERRRQSAADAPPVLRITRENAALYPPPSLNKLRGAKSRVGTAAATWYEHFTGRNWDFDSSTYHVATVMWRKLLPGRAIRERELDRKRDRSSRTRSNIDKENRKQRRVGQRL